MTSKEDIQQIVAVIDSIEPGSTPSSDTFILGYLIGALGLTDVRAAMDRLNERRLS